MSIIYSKDSGKYKVYKDGEYQKSYKQLRSAMVHDRGHHWLDGEEPDPDNYFGFVYEITDELTGMKYVGCRQYRYFEYPCASSSNMDHPKYNPRCWRNTDWGSYCGSSKLLSPIVNSRYDSFTFAIISQHRSKLSLQQAEIALMIEKDVLEATLPDGGRAYWNQHIGGAEYNLFGRSYKIKHGYSYHPLYHTWKVNREFMCPEWKEDPQGFCDTIKEPSEGFSIKRRDESIPFSKYNWQYVSLSTIHSKCKGNSKNTSGFTGVTTLASGKFRAGVYIKKRYVSLGHYPTAQDAAKARDTFIKENDLPHTLSILEEC